MKKNNKLIGEFMGLEPVIEYNDGDDWFYVPDRLHFNCDFTYKNIVNYTKAEMLPYNISWDWLMPVIEKIENLNLSKWYDKNNFQNCSVDIEHTSCFIWVNLQYDPGERIVAIHNSTYKTKLETVYNAVIEFIKWYNENR